jgi:DNA-binding SARP family transcriptional activator
MARLAKISRPRLGRVVRRERLFETLDAGRACGLSWVSGPPGAGKTTLVASYVAERRLRVVWYQVDSGDQDIATFFYYLREAARPSARSRLPLLTPEHRLDLPAFARRFFRAWFAPLGDAVVVLDNFHEAAEVLAPILREAICEAPAGVALIIASREPAPPELARFRAADRTATIGWDALRLTVEETGAIAALRGKAADPSAELHERSGGWAAAVTLLIEQPDHSAPRSPGGTAEAVVFDYFASEVFASSSPALRALWLRTAYLPRFTAATARRLAGDDAEPLLEDLCRRHYFIERRTLAEPHYQYHPLFRDFLTRQVDRLLGRAERERLQHRSALALAEDGDIDTAIALHRSAGDHAAAAVLVLAHAAPTLAQGRWQTVARWIDGVPQAMLHDVPWLLHWAGVCRSTFDPNAGRAILEQAYRRFADAGDAAGVLACASAIIEAHFVEQEDFAQLDRWIAVLDGVLGDRPAFPAPDMELRVWTSLLIAISERNLEHRLAPTCVQRLRALCRSADIAVGQRITAASVLVAYLGRTDDGTQGPAAVAEFAPLAQSPQVTALQRVTWTWHALWPRLRTLSGPEDFAHLRAAIDEAADVAHRSGLGFIEGFVRRLGVWAHLGAGELDAGAELIERLARDFPASRPTDVSFDHFVRAWLALLRGQPAAALRHAEICAGITQQTGSSNQIANSCGFLSQALVGCGQAQRGLEVARIGSAWAPKSGGGLMRFGALAFEADALRALGRRDEFLAVLRETLAAGRQGGALSTLTWLPDMMARLCAEALAADIETDYAERLIRERGLQPPHPEVERWPWPVRLYTLGRFSLVLDGTPARFAAAKAPRKPLELLQALIAFGGRDVAIERLTAALWPEDEGDAAHNSFDNTLHRLRKLIGRDDALLVRKGTLALNDRVCWSDARAFERLAQRALAPADDGAAQAADAAIALYRGGFLARETDAAWAVGYREKLRSRVLRIIDTLAAGHEQAGRTDELVALCERGLDIDDSAEGLYRRLMLAHLHRGERSEALRAYRRCRDTLAAVGVAPSAATEKIHRLLLVP